MNWDTVFRDLWDRACVAYRSGKTTPEQMFGDEDRDFLASMGHKPRELFDFIEDFCQMGVPLFETALLIAAVRRDYFNVVDKGVMAASLVAASSLPPKTAEMDGIVWLPRIIAKAQAKLGGELDEDTMYSCGGDRAFLTKHGIHAADFLRVVWAAKGDEESILNFVKGGFARE